MEISRIIGVSVVVSLCFLILLHILRYLKKNTFGYTKKAQSLCFSRSLIYKKSFKKIFFFAINLIKFRKFSLDELLTIVMVYWVNGNIMNAIRFYKEQVQSPHTDPIKKYVALPCFCFPNRSYPLFSPKQPLSTFHLTNICQVMTG